MAVLTLAQLVRNDYVVGCASRPVRMPSAVDESPCSGTASGSGIRYTSCEMMVC